MSANFPAPVPEIPVSNLDAAARYYETHFGFTVDWIGRDEGIAGISKDHCRMFLSDSRFRNGYENSAPVIIWLNFNSQDEVDEVYKFWKNRHAKILATPESKSWGLYEFTAADQDGNLFRAFFDFATPAQESKKRALYD